MSRVGTAWRSLHTQVLEHRAQLALSIRVTIATLLGFELSQLLNVPLPLWTVLTAVILTQATFGRSLKATIDYFAGTLGGAVYAGCVAALVPHADDLSVAGVLALAVAPLALLGAIIPSFSAATFTGALVILIPGFVHVSPIESALDRVLEVAVGGVSAIAVSLLVLPARAHSFAIEAAARMLDLAARSVPELFAGFVRPRDAAAISRIQDNIGQAVTQMAAIAAEARQEQMSFLAAAHDPGSLLRTLLRLRHDLLMIGWVAAEPLPETLQARLGPPLARVAETIADHLGRSGDALTARREPPPLDAAEAAFDGYAEAFEGARRDGLLRGLSIETVEPTFTLGFALNYLRHNFRDLDRCVREAVSAN